MILLMEKHFLPTRKWLKKKKKNLTNIMPIKTCYSSKLRLKRSIKGAGICPRLTCTDEESSHLAFSAASRTLWSAMLSLVKSTPV